MEEEVYIFDNTNGAHYVYYAITLRLRPLALNFRQFSSPVNHIYSGFM